MTRSDSVASGDVRLWHVPGSVGATYGTEPAHREAALIRTSPALVVVVLLAGIPLVGCGGGDSSSPTAPSATPGGATPDPATSPTMSPTPTVGVKWQFDGSEWSATGTPPACPEPLTFTTPVDLSRVTSILYPGQSRGGDYKPHGGFRLDGPGETGVINVIAPMDATITRASRYLGIGELQYLFEFVNDCGIMYRFDHLLGLAPPLQQIVSMLPPATAGDSRDVRVVQRGECSSLAVESCQPLGILSDRLGQYFDRHIATEVGVRRPIHLAHPAFADLGSDFIRAEASAGRQGHNCVDYTARSPF